MLASGQTLPKRTTQYIDIYKGFLKGKITREGMFVFTEIEDIIEIYELWNQEIIAFPGLLSKITSLFSKGPILKDEEISENSSNRPRNDLFVILMAGKLKLWGINILAIEDIPSKDWDFDSNGISLPDITFEADGLVWGMECKRLRTWNSLYRRYNEGKKQLTKLPNRYKGGMVAIDCSMTIRPSDNILSSSFLDEAEEYLTKHLHEQDMNPIIRGFCDSVLGVILYARIPVHTIYQTSQILRSNGQPYITYMQNTASTLSFIINEDCSHSKYFNPSDPYFCLSGI